MGFRYIGRVISPSVNPLAANVTTSPNVAQYNGVFSLEDQSQALTSGQWATEPNFKQTTLLLHADGKANGSQNNTFLDSSTNSFTITRNGNTTQGTSTPFSQPDGYWSDYFSGGTLWMLTAFTTLMTGDWTVECWIYLPTALTSTYVGLLGQTNGSGNGLYHCWELNNAGCRLLTADGNTYNTINYASAAPAAGQWHHVAWSNSGTTNRFYLNGVYQGSVSQGAGPWTSAGGYTMVGRAAGDTYTGYISNMRVVNGAALYTTTTSFTVPQGPLTTTVSSGTTLFLSCQSNTFVDNSVNHYAYDPTSTFPTIQSFGPFAPQYAYTTSQTGGSGYFDGSSSLTTNATTALNVGTGDVTIEAWVYLNALPANGYWVLDQYSNPRIAFQIDSTGKLVQYDWFAAKYTSTAKVTINNWVHVAIVRYSGTWHGYINGVDAGGSAADSTNYSSTTAPNVGDNADSRNYFNGYISGLRAVKAAVYTSAFTPPTAPPTAVANTSLLLNFTNAGIVDSTSKNDLQTVGSAQVSTSVVKYGSGSLKFNGSTDYLKTAYKADLLLNGANSTIEGWFYLNAAPGTSASGTAVPFIYQGTGYAGSPTLNWAIFADNTYLYFIGSGATYITTAVSIVPVGQWFHIAACVTNGTSATLYVNGVSVASGSISAVGSNTSYSTGVGGGFLAGSSVTQYMNGYADEVRITKGVARYTSNFIPPKVAFSNQ